ncbi:hypothetical protein [Alkalibacter saccharofermentans]|uniref:Uncharacterized protein n=1 Tax=Alkalibacter saccharofermentans DSM 14828 TaxID=1120975 RepID=A0A1M4U779_9FIRM|nr:hypothetical protein [Alkalibacter saccharofermentans]SHE52721.1 hypothetical protein SAMN02746064_00671 [Alkalibacter saccharofermentans DSM 14828]
MKLPDKHSNKWFLIMLAIFILVVLAMVSVSLILQLDIGIENILGFSKLALIVSFAAAVGGYFGFKRYFLAMLVSNIIGIVYMLMIVINRTAEGWSDLVSIISYMFVMFIGFFAAIGLELVESLRNKKAKKN